VCTNICRSALYVSSALLVMVLHSEEKHSYPKHFFSHGSMPGARQAIKTRAK
jgi:hypothetical protein